MSPSGRYEAFLTVLDRDASDSLAAIELVLAQTCHQLPVDRQSERVDSSPRALLTDLFLMDEILKAHRSSGEPASAS